MVVRARASDDNQTHALKRNNNVRVRCVQKNALPTVPNLANTDSAARTQPPQSLNKRSAPHRTYTNADLIPLPLLPPVAQLRNQTVVDTPQTRPRPYRPYNAAHMAISHTATR